MQPTGRIWFGTTVGAGSRSRPMPSIEPAVQTFLYGFLASYAVEIVTLYRLYLLDQDRLPRRYRKVGFWVVRVLVATVAGGLAVA